ncbi:unnamed protein product [Brassicogethes aeneus]|uniref:Uncharacterized protein n=1 Tax=Brassicogethes aeneus TaxID=1431903 RepID=A0A9P0B6E3_BRAAE|nr:unnamed protein product [Brassicogethes aeneus]
MKEYAIVRFVETNDFSEIPNNWIQNRNSEKITCKWPPPTVKNTNSLIKSRCSPGIDWLSYEIEILKYCDTLEKARKLAEDADYTSSDEILGRGCRKRQPSAVASMEINLNESESSDDDLTNIPASQLPTFRADNIATESTTNNFDNMSEVLFVEVDGNNYGENKENVIQRLQNVEEVILKKFPDWTCAEFEKTGLNWFRLGSQRSGNQPSQKQKRNSETATSNAETKKIRYTIFPTQHNQTL